MTTQKSLKNKAAGGSCWRQIGSILFLFVLVGISPAWADFDGDGIPDNLEIKFITSGPTLMSINAGGSTSPGAELREGSESVNITTSTTGLWRPNSFGADRFSYLESITGNGVFTFNFDKPVFDLEFMTGNLHTLNGLAEIGNFSLTFEDGTVLTNVDFTIFPDAIAPGATYGLFGPSQSSTANLATKIISGSENFIQAALPGQSAARFRLVVNPAVYENTRRSEWTHR